ncbi:unnamed protein product [Choristocarpus tenellus]
MYIHAIAPVLCFGGAAAFTTPFLSQGIRSNLASQGSRSMSMSGNIAVFGATGLTGSEVVYQALGQGCKVSAFCRDPSKLVVPAGSGGSKAGDPMAGDENLRTVQGNVMNRADVDKVFENGDITGVVVALGGKTKDVGKTMLTDGTTNIIEAMKAKEVKKIVVMTSIGVGDSEKQAPFFFKVLMYTAMKSIFEDKNKQEALFTKGPGKDLEVRQICVIFYCAYVCACTQCTLK